ncbi:hypothetical protein ACIPO9_12800 [Pseudomonas sp. NPDC090203]|uniref:hypothetical protein n=1 Tax=Pseudomonas sp. NPDC090203 TaxID=3364477 RepID=UPI003818D265
MVDLYASSDQAVRVPRYAFEVMAAMTALDEDKVAVMLLLLVRMDVDRTVKIYLDQLPEFLTVRPERVDRAVSSLIERGWITLVDMAAMRSRILACVVHPAFLDSDFDGLMRVVYPRMFKADGH